MEIENRTVWVIMTKCRNYIAKGTPRNRELIEVNNMKDKKRFLTYSSKKLAESGFTRSGFSTYNIKNFPYNLGFGYNPHEIFEAVECNMVFNTID